MRRDNLPEGTRYRDTGCTVAPRCLACPLQVCKYDDPRYFYSGQRAARDGEILRQRDRGRTAPEIAARLGISIRTVARASERRAAGGIPAGVDDAPALTLSELAATSIYHRRTPWPALFRAE
jgi:hypothetical protein